MKYSATFIIAALFCIFGGSDGCRKSLDVTIAAGSDTLVPSQSPRQTKSSTAAADSEQTTCDSPCDCHDAYGEGRWSVKTDASLPPTDASAIQAVTPSDMFSWPGPDTAITMQSERTGI